MILCQKTPFTRSANFELRFYEGHAYESPNYLMSFWNMFVNQRYQLEELNNFYPYNKTVKATYEEYNQLEKDNLK